MAICLVAIAKNEGRFIAEWLAHYLAIGVDQIVLFDNESTDATGHIADAAGAIFPVTRIIWPSRPRHSPQISAYNHALKTFARRFEWLAFFDCDEFLVLMEDAGIAAFLQRFDRGVGAIGINWLGFGSSGRLDSDYELVTDTFHYGPRRRSVNNRHIKTIARAACVERVRIHDCILKSGAYVHPDGMSLTMSRKPGVADRVDHSIAQLNHYQIKSRADFEEKILRGRAGKVADDPGRIRVNPEQFFAALDINKVRYREIDRNREERLAVLAAIREAAAKRSLP